MKENILDYAGAVAGVLGVIFLVSSIPPLQLIGLLLFVTCMLAPVVRLFRPEAEHEQVAETGQQVAETGQQVAETGQQVAETGQQVTENSPPLFAGEQAAAATAEQSVYLAEQPDQIAGQPAIILPAPRAAKQLDTTTATQVAQAIAAMLEQRAWRNVNIDFEETGVFPHGRETSIDLFRFCQAGFFDSSDYWAKLSSLLHIVNEATFFRLRPETLREISEIRKIGGRSQLRSYTHGSLISLIYKRRSLIDEIMELADEPRIIRGDVKKGSGTVTVTIEDQTPENHIDDETCQ